MAAVRTVPVHYRILEVVEAEPGFWCPPCALSTGVYLTIASQAVVAGIEGPLKLSTGVRCPDHGWVATSRG